MVAFLIYDNWPSVRLQEVPANETINMTIKGLSLGLSRDKKTLTLSDMVFNLFICFKDDDYTRCLRL